MKYTEEMYRAIYKEIVKRIGELTTETITMMSEDDFTKHEPAEAMDRLLTPMLGLFGKILTRGLVNDALTDIMSKKEIGMMLEDLKIA